MVVFCAILIIFQGISVTILYICHVLRQADNTNSPVFGLIDDSISNIMYLNVIAMCMNVTKHGQYFEIVFLLLATNTKSHKAHINAYISSDKDITIVIVMIVTYKSICFW